MTTQTISYRVDLYCDLSNCKNDSFTALMSIIERHQLVQLINTEWRYGKLTLNLNSDLSAEQIHKLKSKGWSAEQPVDWADTMARVDKVEQDRIAEEKHQKELADKWRLETSARRNAPIVRELLHKSNLRPNHVLIRPSANNYEMDVTIISDEFYGKVLSIRKIMVWDIIQLGIDQAEHRIRGNLCCLTNAEFMYKLIEIMVTNPDLFRTNLDGVRIP